MQNMAKQIEQEGTNSLQRGLVKGRGDGTWLVETGGEMINAWQGFSCLLSPEPEDLVLLSMGVEGNYILAILERTSGARATLAAPQGLNIHSPEGEVEVRAARLRLDSEEVEIKGREVSVAAQNLSLLGRLIHTQAQRIKNTAASMENLISRLKEKLLQSHRIVEGMDLVQASHITREAEDLYAMRSAYSVMSCKEDIKVDARHIHLG